MKGIKRTAIAALVFLMMFTLPAQGMKEQQEGEEEQFIIRSLWALSRTSPLQDVRGSCRTEQRFIIPFKEL